MINSAENPKESKIHLHEVFGFVGKRGDFIVNCLKYKDLFFVSYGAKMYLNDLSIVYGFERKNNIFTLRLWKEVKTDKESILTFDLEDDPSGLISEFCLEIQNHLDSNKNSFHRFVEKTHPKFIIIDFTEFLNEVGDGETQISKYCKIVPQSENYVIRPEKGYPFGQYVNVDFFQYSSKRNPKGAMAFWKVLHFWRVM